MELVKRSVLIAVAAVAMSICVSWSYVFYVQPVGRLGGRIVFEFYDQSHKRIATNITDFAVCERTKEGSWRPVWSLADEQRLKDITYGAKYRGLKETVAARKLVAGKLYGAFASDGSGGSAGRSFRFNDDGTIVLAHSVD
jgi:hypothetical protein